MNKCFVLRMFIPSLLLFGLTTGCANKEVSALLTPGSELNNYYSQKAPNVNESPKSAATTWTESRADAMLWAENSNRAVLAFFTLKDGCNWCKKLEQEVFQTPEFVGWANENAVPLRIEISNDQDTNAQPVALKAQNAQLAQIYNSYISGYPTVLLLDKKGRVLGKPRYVKGGPRAWIATAEQQLQRR